VYLDSACRTIRKEVVVQIPGVEKNIKAAYGHFSEECVRLVFR
jgi:hypothetical protein